MLRCAIVAIAIAVAWCGWGASAFAAGENPIGKAFLDEAQKFDRNVHEQQSVLQAKDALEEAEVCAYLRDVLWLVYKALDAYNFDRHDVPDELQSLVAEGYISSWPLNPLDEWRPLKVLDVSDGFQPGQLVVQWAPPSHQSLVGSVDDYTLRPLSYQVAIYGWTEKAETYGLDRPMAGNRWAVVPTGIIAMLGTYSEPAAKTLEKMRKRIAQVQHEKEENQ